MGTQAQNAYATVSRLEGELNHVMDAIPAPALESERTRDALAKAAGKLEEVVRLLEVVRDEEGPRYERSPAANRAA